MLRRFVLAALALAALASPSLAQDDVKNSQDHPRISRMPGFVIERYKVDEFGSYDPVVVNSSDKVHWSGRKYEIAYRLKEDAPTVSNLQIVRNYEAAIRRVGGTILGSDALRVAAEIRRDGGLTGVFIRAANGGRNYTVHVVEAGVMRQDVVADAAAMGRDIAATGKVVVYGVLFDTGKATIRSDSDSVLAQMVKLLQANRAMKIYVVGHTDNAGTPAANLKLSADRAQAVVTALVDRGIARGRLAPAGVGSYCPVAPNRDDAGRARNRRVELVEQ